MDLAITENIGSIGSLNLKIKSEIKELIGQMKQTESEVECLQCKITLTVLQKPWSM